MDQRPIVWEPREIQVYLQDNDPSEIHSPSSETFEQRTIRELLAERREMYELMAKLKDSLQEKISLRKHVACEVDEEFMEKMIKVPRVRFCHSPKGGTEMLRTESSAEKACNRSFFIRWYSKKKN